MCICSPRTPRNPPATQSQNSALTRKLHASTPMGAKLMDYGDNDKYNLACARALWWLRAMLYNNHLLLSLRARGLPYVSCARATTLEQAYPAEWWARGVLRASRATFWYGPTQQDSACAYIQIDIGFSSARKIDQTPSGAARRTHHTHRKQFAWPLLCCAKSNLPHTHT